MWIFYIILFFASLLGIIILLGRKLPHVRAGRIEGVNAAPEILPSLEKLKKAASEHSRRYAYEGVVAAVRAYVKSGNYLKAKSKDIRDSAKKILRKANGKGQIVEPQEVNKFLQMVSDYKEKLSHIKHKVKEEEGERGQ